jgi:hypothetical protein
MNTARTGYDALEALTDGTITDEERGWLNDRAAESPEWAAAITAHTPPSAEETEQMVDAVLRVLDQDKVIPLAPKRRAWLRPVTGMAAAIAAGVVMFSLMGPGSKLPHYAASREGAGTCTSEQVRAVEGGACEVFVLRPATALDRSVFVKAYDVTAGVELKVERLEMLDGGVVQVYLSSADAAKKVGFVVGAAEDMPSTFEAARARLLLAE